jgi:hypothetical protein
MSPISFQQQEKAMKFEIVIRAVVTKVALIESDDRETAIGIAMDEFTTEHDPYDDEKYEQDVISIKEMK